MERMAKSLVAVRRSIGLCHVVFAHNVDSCISNSFPYKKSFCLTFFFQDLNIGKKQLQSNEE